MEIKKEIDKTKHLTIFTVNGELDVDELKACYESYYEDESPSMNMLWDFRSASGGNKLTNELLEYFSSFPQKYGDKRPKGKTAYVVESDLGFGLGRMLSTFVQIRGAAVKVNVFRSMEEAFQWLESDE